jgi:hypothetical protein
VLDPWLSLLERVLRPARPDLDRCLREREQHVEARRAVDAVRAQKIAACEARIVALREDVFAAADGVVTSKMTALEREWRALSRRDPDAGLMDLWARAAPPSWIDNKRWRDSAPDDRLDASVALAADVDGVEAAERAVSSLRDALTAWGGAFGPRVRWCVGETDFEGTAALLADVVSASCEELARRGKESAVLADAQRLERQVHEAARSRVPQRGSLAKGLAHAAFVDHLTRAAALSRESPVAALRDLWGTGYVLATVDGAGVTLALPPL